MEIRQTFAYLGFLEGMGLEITKPIRQKNACNSKVFGGEGGIRTPVTVPRKRDFELLACRKSKLNRAKKCKKAEGEALSAFLFWPPVARMIRQKFALTEHL